MTTASPLAVGSPAPDFTLADQNGVVVTLSALTARTNVVVVFFPFAFSGICTGELDVIRDQLERFVGEDREVVCISCDSVFAQRAWADAQGYFFPILSDFWPHGEVARSYGVFHEERGMAVRGTFLVDRTGRIAWTLVNPPGMARDFGGIEAALAALPSSPGVLDAEGAALTVTS